MGAQGPDQETLEALDRIRRGYEAFNAGDVDAFLEVVHPDIEFHSRVMSNVYRGHAGIRRYFREWIVEPWERLHAEPESIEALSPLVALAQLHLTGQSRDTGAPVEMRYWEVLIAGADGLLRRRTVFLDKDEARAEATAYAGL